MDFKPEVLEKLLLQSDERLWEMIRRVGTMNGVAIAESPPPAEEMNRLRHLLRSGTINKEQAIEILKNHKSGGTQ